MTGYGESGYLGGEVVGEGVDDRQGVTGLREPGLGVPGLLDLVLLAGSGDARSRVL